MTLYPDNVILWRTGKNKLLWRCILTTLYYDVPERTDSIDAVSWQRYTTYHEERFLVTLYPDKVILWRTGKNKAIDAVSRQRYTLTHRKEQRYWRCFPTTLYYDVPERTNSSDVVSRQRYTMTYRKEQTLLTLYPDNVLLWRTGKNWLYWRCILITFYYDVPERRNSIDAVTWQRYTMTYRKEQTLKTLYPDNVLLWRTGKNWLYWRCILTTFYYDVPERTNSSDVVFRQRYTMTYRKDKLYCRCILTTFYYDVPERRNSIDAVSLQRYTMTYRKELYRDNVVLWLHFVRQLLII